VLAGLVVLALLGPACGGPSTGRAAGSHSGVNSSSQLCARLPPAQLRQITGDAWTQVSAPPPPIVWPLDPDPWSCVVVGEPAHLTRDDLLGDGAARSWLWVTVYTGAEGRRLVSELRSRHPVSSVDISGLGDVAIWLPDKSTLGVGVGERGYRISLTSRVLPDSGLEDACSQIARLVMG
jgi:hypothetical protein